MKIGISLRMESINMDTNTALAIIMSSFFIMLAAIIIASNWRK